LGLLAVVTLALPACNDIINYPAPTIKALEPTNINAGNPQFTLTVTGFQFTPASSVLWNGSPILTLFQSTNILTAQIPSSLVQNPGSALVTVFTPQPGGGTTQSLTFDINPNTTPIPQISSISPTGVLAGSPGFQLFIYGSNFVSQSTVTVNGDDRPAGVVNSARIQVQIQPGDVSTAGLVQVVVVNPTGPPSAPGGGASQPATLTVNNPVPTIVTLSPATFTAGSGGGNTLQVQGSSFVPNSVIEIDGAPRVTTFGGGTAVAAQLTAGDFVAAGSHQVRVLNPGPGGGTSNVLAYAVTPTLTAGLPVLLDVGLLGAEANQGVCGQNCSVGPPTLTTAGPSISSNGASVVFASTSTNLITNQANTGSDIFLRTTCVTAGGCTPTTSAVSVGPRNAPSNGSSSEPSIDSSGNHISFTSTATNLVPGIPFTQITRQVYWTPVCTTPPTCSTGALVSMSADGVNAGNGESYNPALSPDGRYVAFVSLATNLVSGLTTLDGVTPQVFLRDTCNGTPGAGCAPTTYLVSTPDGVTPGDGPSSYPSVSENATYVSFTSTASNLGATAPNPNSAQEIFMRNVCFSTTSCSSVTTLISTPDGVTPANGSSSESKIVSGGRFITFASTATNLAIGAGPTQQIYMFDTCLSAASTCSPSATLVSTQDGITPGNGPSEFPSISQGSGVGTAGTTTGEFIAFASKASNLGANTANGVANIFVRRECLGVSSTTTTCTPSTVLASQPGGTSPPQANGDSLIPAISADAHTVTFLSSANNLVANDTNGFVNVFLALTSF